MDCHTTATCWLKLDRPGGDPNQRLVTSLADIIEKSNVFWWRSVLLINYEFFLTVLTCINRIFKIE
ncbi:hypothetical protein Plhal703r1_c32g0123871 [Plasmopara halstedii]